MTSLSIGLPEIIAGIMVLALNAYVLMGGADYGGGVWDLLASGPRRDRQRELISKSIAPIWEANHVWLIVVVVMLFTAFPAAFGTLSTILHLPLTLMLIGIVMRGSAFVFRSYGSKSPATRERWGATFATASLITPIVLGMIIGAIASGKVGDAGVNLESRSFAAVYVWPWLGIFPLAVGGFALSLFALLAAVYLTIEARDDDLREDFRARALAAAVAVLVFASVALVLTLQFAPRVAVGLTGTASAWLLHLCTGISALTVIGALVKRRYRIARLAAGAQVSFILWGWALSQFPYVVPDTLPIRAAAAPTITLELLLGGLVGGALILIPSLRYLFKTFAGKAQTLSS